MAKGGGAFRSGIYINRVRKSAGAKKLPYLRITAGPQRGQYVHILVASAKLGRALRDDETVDHINRDTLDNRPENLDVLTYEEHGRVTARRRRADRMEGVSYEM